MAKKIKAISKMKLKGGGATPAPPVGSMLGQHGVSLMDFCKSFNAETSKRKGETVPVVVTVYTDKTFSFVTKTTPASELLIQKAKIAKGSGNPGTEEVGTISIKDIEEIAKIKMVDLNANDVEAAKKIICGSARSMGLKVVN